MQELENDDIDLYCGAIAVLIKLGHV